MSWKAEESSISGQLRIAALAIGAYETVRIIPLEYRYYRTKGTTPALLVPARYIGIATLVANSSLYFSSHSESLCNRIHLLPGILQLFSAISVQMIIFYRTIDISGRNKTALSIMIFAAILSLPLEAVAIGLNRQPTTFPNVLSGHDGCLSLVRDGVFNTGPVFYLARLVFDLFAIALSSLHLVRRGGWGGIQARLLVNGMLLMLLDAFVYLLTFLGSMEIRGVENLGIIWSIVTSVLVAQHILFLSSSASPAPVEFKHEVLPLPEAVYKSAQSQSTGTLPRFATPSKRNTLSPYSGVSPSPYYPSKPSFDGSASVLQSCVGREALKYRTDGDVNMFQSKTSLCGPAVDDGLNTPISLDVKRLSQQTRKSKHAEGASSDGDITN